jgi:hypothetical protein
MHRDWNIVSEMISTLQMNSEEMISNFELEFSIGIIVNFYSYPVF